MLCKNRTAAWHDIVWKAVVAKRESRANMVPLLPSCFLDTFSNTFKKNVNFSVSLFCFQKTKYVYLDCVALALDFFPGRALPQFPPHWVHRGVSSGHYSGWVASKIHQMEYPVMDRLVEWCTIVLHRHYALYVVGRGGRSRASRGWPHDGCVGCQKPRVKEKEIMISEKCSFRI